MFGWSSSGEGGQETGPPLSGGGWPVPSLQVAAMASPPTARFILGSLTAYEEQQETAKGEVAAHEEPATMIAPPSSTYLPPCPPPNGGHTATKELQFSQRLDKATPERPRKQPAELQEYTPTPHEKVEQLQYPEGVTPMPSNRPARLAFNAAPSLGARQDSRQLSSFRSLDTPTNLRSSIGSQSENNNLSSDEDDDVHNSVTSPVKDSARTSVSYQASNDILYFRHEASDLPSHTYRQNRLPGTYPSYNYKATPNPQGLPPVYSRGMGGGNSARRSGGRRPVSIPVSAKTLSDPNSPDLFPVSRQSSSSNLPRFSRGQTPNVSRQVSDDLSVMQDCVYGSPDMRPLASIASMDDAAMSPASNDSPFDSRHTRHHKPSVGGSDDDRQGEGKNGSPFSLFKGRTSVQSMQSSPRSVMSPKSLRKALSITSLGSGARRKTSRNETDWVEEDTQYHKIADMASQEDPMERGKVYDLSSSEAWDETRRELLTDVYRISNLEPAAMLQKKIPAFRRRMAIRGTVNMLNCSTPVLASMSLRWMQIILVALAGLFAYFAGSSLLGSRTNVWKEFSQFRFTMLEREDGQLIAADARPIVQLGFLNEGCVLNETLTSWEWLPMGVLEVSYAAPIKFDGWFFVNSPEEGEAKASRFQLHGRNRAPEPWEQCGSSTFSWLDDSARLVWWDGLYITRSEAFADNVFDLRVGWVWLLSNVAINVVQGAMVLTVALLAVYHREVLAQKLLLLTLYVSSLLNIVIALGYLAEGRSAESFMPWVWGIMNASLPTLLVVRQDVFVEVLILLGLVTLGASIVNELVVLPDDYFEVSYASIIFLAAGGITAIWRQVLLRSTQKMVAGDKGVYDEAWRAILERPGAREQLLQLSDLIGQIQGREQLKMQYSRKRHDNTPNLSEWNDPASQSNLTLLRGDSHVLRDQTPTHSQRHATSVISAMFSAGSGGGSSSANSGSVRGSLTWHANNGDLSASQPSSGVLSLPPVPIRRRSPANINEELQMSRANSELNSNITSGPLLGGLGDLHPAARARADAYSQELTNINRDALVTFQEEGTEEAVPERIGMARAMSIMSYEGNMSVAQSVAQSVHSVQQKQEHLSSGVQTFGNAGHTQEKMIRRLSTFLRYEQKHTHYGVVDLRYPVTSVDQLFHQAAVMQLFIRARCQQWASQTNGMFPLRPDEEQAAEGDEAHPNFMRWRGPDSDSSRVQWGRLKSVTRAFEKLLRSYGENVAKLCDLSREQIVFEDLSDLKHCFENIAYDPEVVVAFVRNGMDPAIQDSWRSAGFRVVTMYVRIVSGATVDLGIDTHVAEINLVLRAMAELKTVARQRRYRKFRDFRHQGLWHRARVLWEAIETLMYSGFFWWAELFRCQPEDEPEEGEGEDGGRDIAMKGADNHRVVENVLNKEGTLRVGLTEDEQEANLLQFRFLKNSILPGGILESKMVVLSDAMRLVHSNSVFFTTSPLAAALSKRRWRTLIVIIAFVFAAICISSLWNYSELQRGNPMYRFVTLELRNGVTDRADMGTPSLHSLGLLRGRCLVDIISDGGTQGAIGTNVTSEPGVLTVTLPQERGMDGWFFTTHLTNDPDLDPVRFQLQRSDDGISWNAAGSSSWTYSSSIASLFEPLDGYYNVSMARGVVQLLDPQEKTRNFISILATGAISVVLFAAAICGLLGLLRYVHLFFPLLLLSSSFLDGGAAISLFLEGSNHTLLGVQYLAPSIVAAALATWTTLRERVFIWAVFVLGMFLCVWTAAWALVERAIYGAPRVQVPFVGLILACLGLLATVLRHWAIKSSRKLIQADQKGYELAWRKLKDEQKPQLYELISVCEEVRRTTVGLRARQYKAVIHCIDESHPTVTPIGKRLHRAANSLKRIGTFDDSDPSNIAQNSGNPSSTSRLQEQMNDNSSVMGDAFDYARALKPKGDEEEGHVSASGQPSALSGLTTLPNSAKTQREDGPRSRNWMRLRSQRRRSIRDAYRDVDFSQPITSLDQLYSQAAGMDSVLRTRVQAWAKLSEGYFQVMRSHKRRHHVADESGEVRRRPPEYVRWADVEHDMAIRRKIKWSKIKSVDRAIEKLLRSYGEDASRLVDLTRQSIMFQDVESLIRCLRVVLSDSEVVIVRIKNRLHFDYDSNSSAGYRDVALNVRIVNAQTIRLGLCSHVCEVQLLLKDFAMLKDDSGHKRYIRFRNIKGE